MSYKWLSIGLVAAIIATLSGCRNGPCRRPLRDRLSDRLSDRNPPSLEAPIPPRVLPLESIPPTGVPSTPGNGAFDPRDPIRREFREPEPLPPPPREVYYPPANPRQDFPAPDPRVLGDPIPPVERTEPKLLVPVPLPGAVPDRKEPSLLPPPPTERKDLPPALTEKPRATPPLDLPAFATALDRGPVTTSGKPELDGYEWLKKNGYKTVVYLHEPGANDVTSARTLAEKKGLTFVAVPVSPETLPAAFATFEELVRDAKARPLHVFATSGNRAGSLWYLVYRQVEFLSADAARVRAGKLGLGDPADSAEAKQFWLAVSKVLSNR